MYLFAKLIAKIHEQQFYEYLHMYLYIPLENTTSYKNRLPPQDIINCIGIFHGSM